MKIDEACIDHVEAELIYDLCLWEVSDNAEIQKTFTLGYIQGISELAKQLKEVLKA